MGKESFTFLSKYLATFSGTDEDAVAINEVKEDAVRAVVEFVKTPDLFRVSYSTFFLARELYKKELRNSYVIACYDFCGSVISWRCRQ